MENWKILTQKRIEQIKEIIDTHDKYKNSYMWNLRYKLQPFKTELNFMYQNKEYAIIQQTNPSRRYVYYSLYVSVDGIKKNIRELKKLVN